MSLRLDMKIFFPSMTLHENESSLLFTDIYIILYTYSQMAFLLMLEFL